MKVPPHQNIVTSLWMAGSAGRRHLLGILRFADEIRTWTIKVVSDTSELTDELLDSNITGFIGDVTPQVLAGLQRRNIPAVVFKNPVNPPPEKITFMTDDDMGIGRMGAKYLLSLGKFSSFIFLTGQKNYPWALSRQKGFEQHLADVGMAKDIRHPPAEGILEWLQNLPKPIAAMVAYDFHAKEIIDTCTRIGIEIPNQMAILSVDNDELICDYTRPTLSSIRINHEAIGYRAAKALHALLVGKSTRTREILIRHAADGVIERESTRPIPPVTFLANKIHSFITAHVRDHITVEDVVRHAGVSRRIADLRLKESTGMTIHKMLVDARLKLIANFLKRSRLQINKITRLCGFQNIQRAKYIFKARYGVSMRAFRTRAGKVTGSTSTHVSRDEKA